MTGRPNTAMPNAGGLIPLILRRSRFATRPTKQVDFENESNQTDNSLFLLAIDRSFITGFQAPNTLCPARQQCNTPQHAQLLLSPSSTPPHADPPIPLPSSSRLKAEGWYTERPPGCPCFDRTAERVQEGFRLALASGGSQSPMLRHDGLPA
jgi:hypothetical protein